MKRFLHYCREWSRGRFPIQVAFHPDRILFPKSEFYPCVIRIHEKILKIKDGAMLLQRPKSHCYHNPVKRHCFPQVVDPGFQTEEFPVFFRFRDNTPVSGQKNIDPGSVPARHNSLQNRYFRQGWNCQAKYL